MYEISIADIKKRSPDNQFAWLNAVRNPGDVVSLADENGEHYLVFKPNPGSEIKPGRLNQLRRERLAKGLSVEGFTPEEEAAIIERVKNRDKNGRVTFDTIEEFEAYTRVTAGL
jgi:hypothetical protein